MTLGGNIRLGSWRFYRDTAARGYGAALMQQMLAHIPRNRDTVIECPASQRAYFEKFGFEVTRGGL
ncbi:MAG: hypothetical protein U0176_26530 [Bacteroidia bacterium]